MITEENLVKLKTLAADHGGTDAETLTMTLRDLETAIAAQALLVRNLLLELRNRQADAAALEGILSANTLSATMGSIGAPKRNPFTVAEAEQRIEALNDSIAAANDFGQIIGRVVEVAKIFV
jgi:hypothetical protein